jgi:hypothetical protein
LGRDPAEWAKRILAIIIRSTVTAAIKRQFR